MRVTMEFPLPDELPAVVLTDDEWAEITAMEVTCEPAGLVRAGKPIVQSLLRDKLERPAIRVPVGRSDI